MDGKGAAELDEILKEKEAKTQAILLEMVRAALMEHGHWNYINSPVHFVNNIFYNLTAAFV